MDGKLLKLDIIYIPIRNIDNCNTQGKKIK